ncbi:hypothetical protein EMPS_04145 [Entomortierella parvispora]|uniref:Mitochondrial carrier n=1 Tax=Entomortierella parvispora TaxID=205924 RepID=A0A9P3H8K2_9FUNG|nr:hypothetical protein EMPS_04145 [Entomortierella parvispora]
MPPVPESFDHSRIDFHRYYFYATTLNVPPLLIMFPFRTVRLVQQSKSSTPVSTSVFKVMRDVRHRSGFRALYAGSTIFTTGVTATKILQFATYDYTAQTIKEHHYFGYPILQNSRVLSGVLGSFSAVVTTFFIVPFDMISQQITIAKAGSLPNASNIPLYVTGSFEPLERAPPMTIYESLRSQFKQEGLRFLFRGYYATLLATAPFFAAYFPAYEIARVWVKDKIDYMREIQAARRPNPNPFPPLKSHQFLISSIAGSFASLAAVLVSSPCDMVKTRIQTEQRLQPTNGSGIKLPLPSLKWMDVFKEIWKKEGPMAFFSGTKARAILAVPGGALNFIIFDYVRCKSLKEVPPMAPIQAERSVMFATLFALDKQFNETTEMPMDVDSLPQQSVMLQTDNHPEPEEWIPVPLPGKPRVARQPINTSKPSLQKYASSPNPKELPSFLLEQDN